MQKKQKVYPPEFKREAVRLAQTSGKPITQIARELGISDTSIHQWRKELTEHGSQAFPGSGHQTALEEENRRGVSRMRAHSSGTRHTKKNYSYLLARPAVRYQAIERYREEYPVTLLCKTLEVGCRVGTMHGKSAR